MDTHFRSFEKKVLPELVTARIGVLGMKSMGNGAILKSGAVTPLECLHYALNLPTSVVITGIDSMKILKQALKAAATFKPFATPHGARLRAKSGQGSLWAARTNFSRPLLFLTRRRRIRSGWARSPGERCGWRGCSHS